MGIDHSETHYCEAYESETGWKWKVYHYDSTGFHEEIIRQSDRKYSTAAEAEDAASTWCDENDIDAEIV